ncbi:MAG: hypothetical protein PHP53_22225 [Prolixibacteraceae bacterium]|jgi:uncharacterized protein YjbJ (UPF0337 family)|nr:hypothetical protein [Prolixibacteraceae bacterium]
MELRKINGSWEEQKVKLKKRFVKLQDSDLILEEGKKEEMISKLEIKLGKTRDELQNILAGL